MTTVCRLGVLLFIPLLAGLGSTGAQAYDPRVTTRPSDLTGGRSPRVVRDHRYPGGPAGGVTVTATQRDPVVRDHRADPVVRDHRTSGPFVPDNWTPGPIVRDHRRPGPIVRDYRGQNGAPQGGVIVTSSTRQRGSTPCIRNILGGPCTGSGGQWTR
jgi:hypothetical protein